MTAERYLLEAAVPTTQSRRSYAVAQLELAALCGVARGGRPRARRGARTCFGRSVRGARHAAGARRRRAWPKRGSPIARGHAIGAHALYSRASAELEALGLRREQADATRRLAALAPSATHRDSN